MTDKKWTPGPWYADTSEPGDCVVFALEDEFVANIGRSRIQSLMVAFDCDTANARLIAAAPDLYDALELADYALSGANMDMRAVEKKVRAALAKARGE